MNDGQGPVSRKSIDNPHYSIDSHRAMGVLVGEHNTQVNYVEERPPGEPLRQLPRDRKDFTGRTRELAALKRVVTGKSRTVLITALAGRPGVGKSAVAIHLAHQLAGRYRHAHLYADLRGADAVPVDSGDVLAGFLRALGMRQAEVPPSAEERAAAYRSLLSGKHALIVLDNAAHEAQVRPLLPGSSRCLVILTSRRDLVLDSAESFVLDVMDDTEAVELFARIAGAERVAEDPQATRDIVDLCGRLPLAIQIAAARLRKRPAWPASYLRDRLSDERDRLAELRAGDLDIRASFSMSYQELPADDALLFRRLGAVPGAGIDIRLAAALANATADRVGPALERLADMHLIEADRPGRYEIHDLLRLFAREHLADEDGPPIVSRAIHDTGRWYSDMTRQTTATALTRQPNETPSTTEHDQPTALAWLDAEWADAVGAAEAAARAGHLDTADDIVGCLYRFLVLRDNYAAIERISRQAYETGEQRRDPAGMSRAALNIANALAAQGSPEALGWYETAVHTAEQAGQREHVAYALINLAAFHRGKRNDESSADQAVLRLKPLISKMRGTVAAAVAAEALSVFYARQRDVPKFLEWAKRTYDLAVEAGSPTAVADAAVQLGQAAASMGGRDEARSRWAEAIEHARADITPTEARIRDDIGRYCLQFEWLDEACVHLKSALDLHRQLGNRKAEAATAAGLARAHLLRKDTDQARQYAEQALTLTRELRDRHAEGRCAILVAAAFSAQGEFAAAAARYNDAHRILLPLDEELAAMANDHADKMRQLQQAMRPRPKATSKRR
jgi:tetratricopeptide (TPR) repeat protein